MPIGNVSRFTGIIGGLASLRGWRRACNKDVTRRTHGQERHSHAP